MLQLPVFMHVEPLHTFGQHTLTRLISPGIAKGFARFRWQGLAPFIEAADMFEAI